MHEDSIKWSAPEYDHREHSADWYWIVGIITFSLATALFIVGNLLLSIIIVIGVGILIIHTVQKPKYLDYQISEQGIHIQKKLYSWDSLKSFCILRGTDTEEERTGARLFIVSKQSLVPLIVIPLGNAPIDEIHEVLLNVLAEEPQAEPFPDRIIRKLGF